MHLLPQVPKYKMDRDTCLSPVIEKTCQDAEVWQGSIVVQLVVMEARALNIQMNQRGFEGQSSGATNC